MSSIIWGGNLATSYAMNNKEYIYELSQRCGYTQENTQKYVRSVIEVMASRFDEGENVSVPNFGTFELKNRMERIVVNPSTSENDGSTKDSIKFKPVAFNKRKTKKIRK